MPPQETNYAPVTFIYRSKGLTARPTGDQVPEYQYLDMLNCLEREENTLSSRYGTVVVNRDQAGYGITNYPFAAPANSLGRLTYKGVSWRYAGLTNGQLLRRSGETQGSFPLLYSGLSGKPWQSLVTSCFETAQPYLFVYDSAVSIKDAGTGVPTLTGIDPSNLTLTTLPYAPLLTLIDSFASANSYDTTGITWSYGPITTLDFTSGSQVTDFPQLFDASPASLALVTRGMISNTGSAPATFSSIASVVSSDLIGGLYTTLRISTAAPHGASTGDSVAVYGSTNSIVNGYYSATVIDDITLTVPFSSAVALGASGGSLFVTAAAALPEVVALANIYSTPYQPQASAWGFYGAVPPAAASLPVGSWSGSIGQNSSATIGKTLNLDLSQANQVTDDDLIVLTLAVGDPAAISNIRLQFDVAGSGYTSSYYYKDLAPAYYQSGVQNLETAYTTTEQQILANTLGLLTGQPPNSTTAALQPGNLSTGQGSWVAVLLRRGDFVAVGTAGDSGLDWSAITGWQLAIDTNTIGSSSVATNGLYLQWGYGPTSFGGTGFDYRQTYYNAATGTESNGTSIQVFGDLQYGWLASQTAPILLSQAARLQGNYSNDPQVTHLRFYRRGGGRSATWFQLAQTPNVPGAGQFQFKDVVPDAVLAQAQPLILDNDAPVTSSLQSPIVTQLTAASLAPGTSVFSVFTPQVVPVADLTASFVVGQIVDVGYSYNLEQVRVITAGVGQFTAILRLQHNAGEPVAVYSIPRQPCNLCALAYDQVWLAGDPNNPNYLYFSKRGRPESFGPQNYIPVGSPQYPIKIVVNWRGTLFVCTSQKWWIINGGAQPTAQPTGSIHGAVSSAGWCEIESGIVFRAPDGIRVFAGSDGQYLTLPVEFLFRQQQAATPVPVADPARASEDCYAYYNNVLYAAYWALDGKRYRLVFDFNYQRFRYDDVAATAMLWEPDTNVLLVAKQQGLAAGPNAGQSVLVQDQITTQDYDDGGFVAGLLQRSPVSLVIQHPYYDLQKPHFPKQWNMLETDCNTQGQAMQTSVLFKTEPPVSLALAAINTGLLRSKAQLLINAPSNDLPMIGGADGFEAFSASIRHTMQVTVAPTLYQENVYAALLADYNNSFDTYWIKLGSDETKIVKQCYFDYTSTTEIQVRLFADGSLQPYYQFTLPPSPSQNNRLVIRKLFRAWKPRLWRMIAISADLDTNFQFWSAPQIESKSIDQGAKGYARTDLAS